MTCNKCKRENLTEKDFYKDKNTKYGHTIYCKECHKVLSRLIYKTGERTEYLRIYRQEWRKKNKEIYRKHKHDYRTRKKGNGGTYTVKEWEAIKKQYKFTCPCCGRKEPEVFLTVDHIVPIVRGGKNSKENLQPLCRKCNTSKQAKTIAYGLNKQMAFVLS